MTVTVPVYAIAIPLVVVVGFASYFFMDWLLQTYALPIIQRWIYRRYVRKIERINAEYGNHASPLPFSHFFPREDESDV